MDRNKESNSALLGWWWSLVTGNRNHLVETVKTVSLVPQTGFEWHSLLSKVPGFPPVQLALCPSLPLLDPSYTLSTGWKNKKTAEKSTQAGTGKAYRQTEQYSVQAQLLVLSAQNHQGSKQKNSLKQWPLPLTKKVERLVTLAKILIDDKNNISTKGATHHSK